MDRWTATLIVDGEIVVMDVIEWMGAFWLVPTWLDHLQLGASRPERAIRLDVLPHHRLSDGRFALDQPVPRSVLEGPIPLARAAGYEVVEQPGVLIASPSRSN